MSKPMALSGTKAVKTCQENLDHYQLKHCQNQFAFFNMLVQMQFQNCTKTGFDSKMKISI